MPNSSWRATAPPTTSARSVTITTSSACSHKPMVIDRGKASRQCSDRLRPVARPSLADRYWMSIAITLARMITQSRA